MDLFRPTAVALTALVSLTAGSVAQADDDGLVVVELFTSQSCSSCPPAEANLVKLAERPDVLALEWHVDYWDDLRVGRAGRWKDPYSNPAHTKRQRQYNQAIRGVKNVYTPQTIVNGQYETVGSRAHSISELITMAAEQNQITPISSTRTGDQMSFAVASTTVTAGVDARALLVTFAPSATTRVGGGENNGRTLAEANVVTGLESLGRIETTTLEKGKATFAANVPDDDHGCALLIQDNKTAEIIAAAYCPQ